MINEGKPYVDLRFYTRQNISDRGSGLRLIKTIAEYGKESMPEEFDNSGRWVSISPPKFESLLTEWGKSDIVLMRRQSRYEAEIAISMDFTSSGCFNTFLYWIEEDYFRSLLSIDNFIRLSVAIYNELKPDYGGIHQTRDAIDLTTIEHDLYGKTVVPTDLNKGFPNVYWGNFFGPRFINIIGREKLKSAPCFQRQDLTDGGILILTSHSPLDPRSEDSRMGQKTLRKHIGEEHFRNWPDE